jgi:hypothetical protein
MQSTNCLVENDIFLTNFSRLLHHLLYNKESRNCLTGCGANEKSFKDCLPVGPCT